MAFNTTPAACRLLFPQLPPELRNEVYSYLVHDEEKPYTYLGMPFAPKTYNVGRTKITFAVVHQGNPSLLNLHKDKFLEAEEYFSCLVPTAVTLWVSVVVKGYMHKAEFASWKTKVEKHLGKLHSKHQWLSKVVKHDFRIFFDAPSTVLGQIGRSGKYVITDLATSMAGVLGAYQEPKTRMETGIYVPAWMMNATYRKHIDINGEALVRVMIPASVERLGPDLWTVLKMEKPFQAMEIEGGKVEWVSRLVAGPLYV